LVIAEFINQNPCGRHLLLAPGTHIFKEIRKHIAGENILWCTYIGLKTSPFLFRPHSFDFIYLDEFHRLGADVWGNNVDRLMRQNPRAKVIGTSATPIRYLDDNRNMATEIFNDCIATQMSLNAAIVKSILPAPIYISSLYSVGDELRKMNRKIMESKVRDKDSLIRELNSKMIDWERSSGLDVVIKKHLGPERRRVVVFCKDWKHLKYAQKILGPIFREIYGEMQSLSLYSKKNPKENEETIELFSGEGHEALILYTIDKVNEGLHSSNCNTVILLRDTLSPIVFYQQIGRAFSIGGLLRPLIIDLVNNFKNVNLESFRHDFEQELNDSMNREWSNPSSDKDKIKTAIQLIDETQDIRKMFSSFEERIDVWRIFYRKARQYYKENGHLYVSDSDKDLCNWVRKQRDTYNKGYIIKERIPLLAAIGIEFGNDISAQWMMRYYELKQWIGKHGELPTITQNRFLAIWIVNQRRNIQLGKVSEKQADLLKPFFPLSGDRTRLKIKARIQRLLAHLNMAIYIR
jgi:superfamily II DNA/RNA helicase